MTQHVWKLHRRPRTLLEGLAVGQLWLLGTAFPGVFPKIELPPPEPEPEPPKPDPVEAEMNQLLEQSIVRPPTVTWQQRARHMLPALLGAVVGGVVVGFAVDGASKLGMRRSDRDFLDVLETKRQEEDDALNRANKAAEFRRRSSYDEDDPHNDD